jgi:hypothetical protein
LLMGAVFEADDTAGMLLEATLVLGEN